MWVALVAVALSTCRIALADAPLVPVQAASVAASPVSEATNVAQTFFSTLTDFSSIVPGNTNWRGNEVSLTNGISGYWIQGSFSAPFSVAAWFVAGWSSPFYLMGSNDGSTWTTLSMTSAMADGCSSSSQPCAYAVASTSQPAFSIYRAVTPQSNYNYAITLLAQPAPPPRPPPPPPSPPTPLSPSSPPPAAAPLSSTALAFVQATTVTASPVSEASNIEQTFFGTLTSFSSIVPGDTNWRGNAVSVTNGISGYWIQGGFPAPFSVGAWFVVGWSSPFFLMGSNDGNTWTTLSMTALTSDACSSSAQPCAYAVASTSQPAFSVYRAVTTQRNYNYAITLLAQPALLPSLSPVQAASVMASLPSETANIALTFFSTLTSFSSIVPGNTNWRGNGLSTTNGISGYWIQGSFSAQFSVGAWYVIGYSSPFYLMGSNDGNTWTTLSMTALTSDACTSSTAAPCAYAVASTSQPAFSVYRAVTTQSNYNYAITLLAQQTAAPAASLPPTAPLVAPPPPPPSPSPPPPTPPPPLTSPPLSPPSPSPPPPVNVVQPSYSGYDVVLVAGQARGSLFSLCSACSTVSHHHHPSNRRATRWGTLSRMTPPIWRTTRPRVCPCTVRCRPRSFHIDYSTA